MLDTYTGLIFQFFMFVETYFFLSHRCQHRIAVRYSLSAFYSERGVGVKWQQVYTNCAIKMVFFSKSVGKFSKTTHKN